MLQPTRQAAYRQIWCGISLGWRTLAAPSLRSGTIGHNRFKRRSFVAGRERLRQEQLFARYEKSALHGRTL
jgi:hypothetical protein